MCLSEEGGSGLYTRLKTKGRDCLSVVVLPISIVVAIEFDFSGLVLCPIFMLIVLPELVASCISYTSCHVWVVFESSNWNR